uniref:S locus F-box-S2C protein n=1 Tax=Antirrhinum hispanicum TaxID=49039 RepID=Q1KQ06_ANTHI|nr:S locus F-box-S2C protein [Antirrhinum hispanicum]
MEKIADGHPLGDDKLIEILLHLPVRSLVRFKCVSISWYNLIRSPTFCNKHFLTSRRNDSVLLVRRFLRPPEDEDVLSFHDVNSPELEQVAPNLSIPFLKDIRLRYNRPYFPEGVTLLGPCNGLLCITHAEFLIFCCPTLREFKRLQPCPYVSPKGFFDRIIGSGFGCTSMTDFKVVLIRSIWFDDVYDYSTYTLVHLYNSNTNSWRITNDVGTLSFKDLWDYPCSQRFFHGNLHWNAASYDYSSRKAILTFNLNTETFGQLEYPDYFKKLHETGICFTIINNCFAIILYKDSKEEPQPLDIWVMKKYGFGESWTKQFTVGPYQVVSCILPWKNDEWLFVESSDGQLATCALHTNEFRRLPIYGVEKTMRAMIYKESLISLNQVYINLFNKLLHGW